MKVWVSILIYDGVISDVHVFESKTDALLYFDDNVKEYNDTGIDQLEDYTRDEETGLCGFFDPDGGRHPLELHIEPKVTEYILKKTIMEGIIE